MTRQQKSEKELHDFCDRYRDMDFSEIHLTIIDRQNKLPKDLLFLEIQKHIHKLDETSVGLLVDFKIILSALVRSNTEPTPENEDYLNKIQLALKT